MRFIKLSLIPAVLLAFVYLVFFPSLSACTKTQTKTIVDTVIRTIDDTTYYDAVCPLIGNYAGTNYAHSGATASIWYSFEADNLAVGTNGEGGGAVTFGGFKNTCDSVVMNVFYTVNSSYYILNAKISGDKSTITGAFYNQTTPSDSGTFTMTKY
jgi:hypothetical protein